MYSMQSSVTSKPSSKILIRGRANTDNAYRTPSQESGLTNLRHRLFRTNCSPPPFPTNQYKWITKGLNFFLGILLRGLRTFEIFSPNILTRGAESGVLVISVLAVRREREIMGHQLAIDQSVSHLTNLGPRRRDTG